MRQRTAITEQMLSLVRSVPLYLFIHLVICLFIIYSSIYPNLMEIIHVLHILVIDSARSRYDSDKLREKYTTEHQEQYMYCTSSPTIRMFTFSKKKKTLPFYVFLKYSSSRSNVKLTIADSVSCFLVV